MAKTCPFPGAKRSGTMAAFVIPALHVIGVAMDAQDFRRIALIGFGEVGGIFGRDLAAAGYSVSVYDILLESEPSRAATLAKAASAGVCAAESLKDALQEADLVISCVTAASALQAAQSAAPFLRSGQVYMDVNSVSPETKQEIAARLAPTPASFIEAAVMAPVHPQRLRVPMLLGGAEIASLAPKLLAIGMNGTPVSERIGVASAIKMCRSIIIKGLEAITVEAMFTARRYRAETHVLNSLAATYPGMGWDAALPDYLISRVAEHGKRRAAEMREAAEAMAYVGIEPMTALATASRQEWLARTAAEMRLALGKGEEFSWRDLADAIAEAERDAEKSPETAHRAAK